MNESAIMSDALRHNRQERPSRCCGAALVTVLGVLTVLTLLGLSFSLVMRMESRSATRVADRLRAAHYAEVGLGRVMEDFALSMRNANRYPYPIWNHHPPNSWGHAYASHSETEVPYLPGSTNLFSGMATNLLPASVHDDIANVTSRWVYVIGVDPVTRQNVSTNGRVAYLAVNLSGLIDANHAISWSADDSATQRLASATVDMSLIPDILDPEMFEAYRNTHRRYETLAELTAFNAAVTTPVSNLFVHSYDPDPGMYMVDTNQFGDRTIALQPRFNINAITNYNDFSSSAFRNEYLLPLQSVFREAGISNANETAWNAVAFLSPGNVPVNEGRERAWQRDYGGKAVPLINEIGLVQAESGAHPETDLAYRFKVELWYPFVPHVITGDDDYWLHVYVYKQFKNASVFSMTRSHYANPDWSFSAPIGAMAYGGATEFNVIATPDESLITFPVKIDSNGHTVTNYLPIGGPFNYLTSDGTVRTVTNKVWFLARVTKGEAHTNVVDEAMGYDPGSEPGSSRAIKAFSNTVTYAVSDPRLNSRQEYWIESPSSFGERNPLSEEPTGTNTHHQGLPIYFPSGPAECIVDIGQVPVYGIPWKTIDLLDASGGAKLLDRLTVRGTNGVPVRTGRVNLNSRHPVVTRSLFTTPVLRQPWAESTNEVPLASQQVDALALAIAGFTADSTWPYRQLSDMFAAPDGGGVAAAFRACVPTNSLPPYEATDYQREYLLRYLIDKTTTREHTLGIILAAQALGPDGRAITADYREFVLVMRDAWTGNWAVIQRFSLDD